MGKKRTKFMGSSAAVPEPVPAPRREPEEEDEVLLATNESFGSEEEGQEQKSRSRAPKRRLSSSSSSSSESPDDGSGSSSSSSSSSSLTSNPEDKTERGSGTEGELEQEAYKQEKLSIHIPLQASVEVGSDVNMLTPTGEPVLETMLITIPRDQGDDAMYEPTKYFEDVGGPPTRRVLNIPPSMQSDFSGSTPITPAQIEIRDTMSGFLGYASMVFEDEATSLWGPQLMELYGDPSRGILADSSCYGPPQPGDPRTREEKAQCCAAALRADSMRMTCLAAGYLPVDTMRKWHPNLAMRYLQYEMAADEATEASGSAQALSGRLQEAAHHVVDKTIVFLDCLGRKLLLDAANPGPAAQALSAAPSAIEQMMAFLGHEDRMPVGDLEWVRDFWTAVSKDPKVLACTVPSVLHQHVDNADRAPSPAYRVRPLPPETEAPTLTSGYKCPYLESCMTGNPATTLCTSMTCILRGLTMKEGDELPVRADRWGYYPMGKVLQWSAMETGPYDNRKTGLRTYVFYKAGQEWTDVRETLNDLGFFESLADAGVATLGALNWTRAALRRRDLLNHRGDQPKGCLAGYSLGAANGVVLVDQCLYGGAKAGFLGHTLPLEVVEVLESEGIYKVQSGIHEEGRFADMGVELTSYVDATLLALTQFPQPGVEPSRMQCNPTYVASRLGSPAIPMLVHQDRRQKKHSIDAAASEGRAFYIDLAEADFSAPVEEWDPNMKLHVFCTMSIPFALMWRAAARAMQLEQCSEKADALRYLRLLLARLVNMPGVNGIGKTSLQRRPWNLVDYHEKGESRHGVPLRAEWVLLDNSDANSVRHPLPTKKMYFKGKHYKYDPYNLDRDLLTFLKDFTNGDLHSLDWAKLMDYHFQMGANSPHVCAKCGTPDHLEVDCVATNLLCLYPLCRATSHLLYVCHRLWVRCDKCQMYGHLAHHHADQDFVRMIENFKFCALFNRRALSLHDCAAFACHYDEDEKLSMTLLDDDDLRSVTIPFVGR